MVLLKTRHGKQLPQTSKKIRGHMNHHDYRTKIIEGNYMKYAKLDKQLNNTIKD